MRLEEVTVLPGSDMTGIYLEEVTSGGETLFAIQGEFRLQKRHEN